MSEQVQLSDQRADRRAFGWRDQEVDVHLVRIRPVGPRTLLGAASRRRRQRKTTESVFPGHVEDHSVARLDLGYALVPLVAPAAEFQADLEVLAVGDHQPLARLWPQQGAGEIRS